MTGTNRIPGNGYPDDSKLRFYLIDTQDKYIDIHSCYNQFMIKTSLFTDHKKNKFIYNKEGTEETKGEIQGQTELFRFFTYDILKDLESTFNSA